MSVVENNIDLSDYEQEVIYHREEAAYHAVQVEKSIQEAKFHQKKQQEHAEILHSLIISKDREVINA